MKKTMVIAIFVVYILSIVAVNFFGLQIKQFEGRIYVNRLECELVLQRSDDSEFTEYPDYNNPKKVWHAFDFVPGNYSDAPESLMANPNKVTIISRCFPDDADNRRVEFEYDDTDEKKGRFYFDKAIATVFFFRANRALDITVKAADGSGVATTITIFPEYFP